jgi:methyl-accepting chemotaxis protein
VNEAIGETNRSADHVPDASGKVLGAAESLAAEVQGFFVRLRDGQLDRRKADDPNYGGPNGRAGGERSHKAT